MSNFKKLSAYVDVPCEWVSSTYPGEGAVKRLDAEIAKLQAKADRQAVELNKLRELVRDMNECLEHSQPLCKNCKFQELDCQWFKFITRMAELGIEVDGCE